MCPYNPYPILCHVSNDRKKEFSQKREGRKETEKEKRRKRKREREREREREEFVAIWEN